MEGETSQEVTEFVVCGILASKSNGKKGRSKVSSRYSEVRWRR